MSHLPFPDTEVREFEYFIGPQHVGITGNFGVHLKAVGDEIVEARANPGYLHRGFEKLMEQRRWIQNIPMVCRICVPDPDVNEVAYSLAVEEIAGLDVPLRAQYLRTMVLEMSRLQAYLLYFGGVAGALGLYTIPQWTVGDRDYLLDRFEELTGGRVYHIYTTIGGVRRDLPEGFSQRLRDTLHYLSQRLKEYDRLMFDNAVFKRRTQGVAVIKREYALQMGVTGPNLRATGVPADVRRDDPYLVYPGLDFEVPTLEEGDIYARVMVRRLEFEQSIHILHQVLDWLDHHPPEPVLNKEVIRNPFDWAPPPGDAFVRVESSKGEYGYYVVSDGGIKPYRVHVRGPSMTHGILVLEDLLKGARIADVAPFMFSLDVCPPDIDR